MSPLSLHATATDIDDEITINSTTHIATHIASRVAFRIAIDSSDHISALNA